MGGQKLDPITITEFSGGINKSTTIDNIKDNELDEGLNVDLNIDGSLSSRKGVDQYNSTLTGASRVTSLYGAKKADASASALIVTTLNKIYKDNGAGGWTDITGTTAPPSNTLWMWRMFNNRVIGVNGTSVPQKYEFGAACADLTGTPPDKCSIIETSKGRVLLAGDGDEPTSIHGCAAGNSQDWTTASDAFTIFVDKDNGKAITGIGKLFTKKIILKRKGVYELLDPDGAVANMGIDQIFDDIGCISPYTVKQIGNDLVWLDDDGVYALRATQEFGDVAYTAISKKIQTYIDDIQLSYLPYAYAEDCRKLNQYRVSVPKTAATTNNHVLVRNYYHGAWLRREGIAFACYGTWEIGGILYNMAGGYDGKVYKLDTLDDDEGANFAKKVSSKRFTHGSPYRKMYHRMYSEFSMTGEYPLAASVDIDYGKVVHSRSLTANPVGGLWDVGLWDVAKWAGQGATRKWTTIGKKGVSAQLQYVNNVKNQPFTLYKFSLEASLEGRRG